MQYKTCKCKYKKPDSFLRTYVTILTGLIFRAYTVVPTLKFKLGLKRTIATYNSLCQNSILFLLIPS